MLSHPAVVAAVQQQSARLIHMSGTDFYYENMITLAKRGDLSARRQLVAQMPDEPLIVDKLMSELATKYADRASGYTRIVKLGPRPGDAAPMAYLELVDPQP